MNVAPFITSFFTSYEKCVTQDMMLIKKSRVNESESLSWPPLYTFSLFLSSSTHRHTATISGIIALLVVIVRYILTIYYVIKQKKQYTDLNMSNNTNRYDRQK